MGMEAGSAAAGEGVPAAGHRDGPGDVAGVLGVRALGIARLAAVPAGISLGLLSASVDWHLAVVNSVFALVWVLLTNRRMARHGLGARSTHVIAVVDVAVVTVGLTVTGGVNSDMRLLLGVLPLAAAFEFRAPVVAAVGLGGAAIMTALSLQDLEELAVNLAVLGWSTATGLALAGDRRALLRRVTRIDDTRSRLLEGHDDAAGRERDRAVDELRLGALEDVQAARAALRVPDGPASAAARCQSAIRRIRGLVSELHALSARPIALRSAIGALARRRAEQSGRAVVTEVDDEVQGVRDDLLLVLVRDLLDAIVDDVPRSTVRVRVRGQTEKATLTVTVEDGKDVPFDQLALARVRERLAGVPGARFEIATGQATVSFSPAAGALRDRVRSPTTRTVLTARLLGGVAVLALAALGGTTSAWFWGPAGTGMVVVAASTRYFLAHPPVVSTHVVLSLVDAVAALCALALAGPAQDELLLLFIGFVPVYACVFGPGVVIVFVSALGLGATAITGFDAAFAIAFVWAAVVAVVLADAAQRATRMIGALLERRREALLGLLASEESARRAVARRLHDDALQLLLAARQDAEEAATEIASEARARAEVSLAAVERLLGGASLRTEVDPPPDAGLAQALAVLAREAEQDGALTARLSVDAAVTDGADAGLVLGLARELVVNVLRHARAAELVLALEPSPGGGVRLVVADDGGGMPPGRERTALAEGHIGLAAARDRVRRRGGTLDITAGRTGRGTTATVVLPPRAEV